MKFLTNFRHSYLFDGQVKYFFCNLTVDYISRSYTLTLVFKQYTCISNFSWHIGLWLTYRLTLSRWHKTCIIWLWLTLHDFIRQGRIPAWKELNTYGAYVEIFRGRNSELNNYYIHLPVFSLSDSFWLVLSSVYKKTKKSFSVICQYQNMHKYYWTNRTANSNFYFRNERQH